MAEASGQAKEAEKDKHHWLGVVGLSRLGGKLVWPTSPLAKEREVRDESDRHK